MGIGIGIDMMDIADIRPLLEDTSISRQVFTPGELQYIHNGEEQPHIRAAGIYCAKEACLKAIGIGLTGPSLRDFEIAHTALGQPIVNTNHLSLQGMGEVRFILSISHTLTAAVAIANAQWEEETTR